MTSRERVNTALNHAEPDRTPLDLGASAVTGMHVSSVYLLRQALGLDAPGTPVKVVEPYQMLGEIAPDLIDALGVDVVGLGGSRTLFGFRNEGWKEWRLFDNTPVLVPEAFNTMPEANGDILMYPGGDATAAPSGRMPKDGFYFDTIIRQDPIDEAALDVEDNLQEFTPISDSELDWYRAEAQRLAGTDKAVLASFGGAAFGDIALVPGQWLRRPRGIRDIAEWYTSTLCRRDYVYEVFSRQCDMALANWEKIHAIVGDLVTAVFVTGTDFGAQHGPFIGLDVYRDLYKPFHRRVNDWIHRNTGWKSFIHSCGSVRVFLEDFIDAGFDILNPVQCSARDMEARELKEGYGDRLVFWGGGVDTQHTLPFGTPEEVAAQVRERVRIFGRGGGFIFNTIHNVQARVPRENLLALYRTLLELAGNT
ncbi:MAG TPA: uroporphyrinogen decarboxylase family protein [Candidatus Hydrogenedentes bacterium]|nr:uroporphyrinogen decarboxylase family protein [Candidatus Hydrogenedentota bacterium]HNT87367.1 uroporphyrinogen decarboxylase family protein [Candidatus Hydrogenedentota bacterium]